MKPAPFDYVRPASVRDALDVLAEHADDACVLAGGQSLMAMLNMRLLTPQIVVDISRLGELNHIECEGNWLVVGAAVTQARLQQWPALSCAVPLLASCLPWVGHYQTRTRGTVCGSIAHADPSSELPLCLKTLGGEVVLRSAGGERRVSVDEFQQGLLSTCRQSDELIVAVRFPLARSGDGDAFREFAIRHGDFAVVASAAHVSGSSVRFAIGGCGDRPSAVQWARDAMASPEQALAEFVDTLTLDDDAHANATYRRQLAITLGRETIDEAMSCAD